MTRGTLGATAAALSCITISSAAHAAVLLRSAEMADGAGHRYQPGFGVPGPGSYSPTTYSAAVAFPNDTRNFAAPGPDGLRIVANSIATFSHSIGNSLSESWTARKFEVKFDLEEPAEFKYTRSIVDVFDSLAPVTLQADGQPPVDGLPPRFGEKSGVLPAGHYTFSGVADLQGLSPWGGTDRFLTAWGGYNVVLTVAPEPTALPVLGGLMVFALRRRRG